MTIKDVIDNFDTTPFLFIGSGMSKRYLGLPNWRELLEHFARIIENDDFAYSKYEHRAKLLEHPMGLMPKIAELIQEDFDEKWFSLPEIRTISDENLSKVKEGLSPFKAELTEYLKRISKPLDEYKEEISLLSELSQKSISGVITTNYDSFIEDHFEKYKIYVGQSNLIFSAIQGIAEIFKIHGSIEEPESIVINELDYKDFYDKRAYLAAKLMTIFIEYPIIFLGYSINDTNIQNIIESIMNCLSDVQIEKLQDRFIFVEYEQDRKGAEVSYHSIMLKDKMFRMRSIKLSDFMLLYNAMKEKRSKLPVRLLRRFKEELYEFTITNQPTGHLRLANLEDERVGDEEFAMMIGKWSAFGLKGLSGITSDEWYRDIVLGDLDASADDLLTQAFENLLKQSSNKLPVFKYLAEAKKEHRSVAEYAEHISFENMISDSIRKHRKYLGEYESVQQIWSKEKNSIERAFRLISYLQEEQFNVNEIEAVLNEIFSSDVNVLSNVSPQARTNIRRVIRIYDYLKWGKKKELSD